MKSNRVMLIGYVARDLAATTLHDGTKRIGMRIATHYVGKNAQGERKWETVWHNVVVWGGAAAYAQCNFVKGSRVMIDGCIEYITYMDKSGLARNITQIKAHSLINLDR